MLRPLALCALLAYAVPAPGAAQDTPEAAATAFGNALRANDWAATARLMHPTALRQLRTLFEPIVAAEGMEQVGTRLFGTTSAAAFASTPDTVLFAAFLRNVLASQQGFGEALRGATIQPLGHVAQGADTMLVVSRMTLTIEGVTISEFDVMPFVHDQGRWWGILKADFTNMAAMMQRALGARKS